MALNESQMKKFSEGSSGTGGRVDELTLPVDISHRSRSPQADANEKDLELGLNLQKENFGAGPSGGSSEDLDPVSESRSDAEVEGEVRVTILEPIREEDQDDGGRTHQPVGDPKNKEESDHICRTCGPDEETTEPDNLLVKLGCHCRGDLSKMHRKCILQWYGPRFCQKSNYKCELCNALLHRRVETVVLRALIGRDSGLNILFKAMRTAPRSRPRPNANVEAHENTRPDFHQINIVEITRPARQPHHPTLDSAPDRPENRNDYGSIHRSYPMCVVFFIILVLVIFVAAFVGNIKL